MVAAYAPLPSTKEPSGAPQRLSSFAALNVVQFATTPEDRVRMEAERFDSLSFITGFLQVLRGPQDDAPIHYPREQAQPDRSGENFRWLVSNERRGKQHALPSGTATKGLPYRP